MNRLNRCVKAALTFSLLSGAWYSTIANAAEVKSLSRELTKIEDGVKQTQVVVSCVDVETRRTIFKAAKSRKWCSSALETVCAKQKIAVAKKVCGTHFDKMVIESRQVDASAKPADQAKQTKAFQPVSTPEEARLLNEQQELTLKLKELEARRLELKKALNTNEANSLGF